MESRQSQEIGPRSISLRIGFCLLAIAILAAPVSCGRSRPAPPPVTPMVIPPDLPVLELPALDVGKTVLPAKEQRSPAALGISIPSGTFVVKIKVHHDAELGPLSKQ